jgi:hypothetical protein
MIPAKHRQPEQSVSRSSHRYEKALSTFHRDDGEMDTDLVQLCTGARVVTDINQVVRQFCRDRGDGLCHVLLRMQPLASH